MQFTQDSVSQYYAGTLSAADRDGHWPANHIVPTEVASILSSKDFDGVIPSGSGSPSYGFGGPLPSYKLKGRNTLSKMLCLLNVYCCYFQSNCQICMLRVSSHLDSTSSYYRSGDIVYISSKITILTWVQLPGSVFTATHQCQVQAEHWSAQTAYYSSCPGLEPKSYRYVCQIYRVYSHLDSTLSLYYPSGYVHTLYLALSSIDDWCPLSPWRWETFLSPREADDVTVCGCKFNNNNNTTRKYCL